MFKADVARLSGSILQWELICLICPKDLSGDDIHTCVLAFIPYSSNRFLIYAEIRITGYVAMGCK